MVEAYQSLLKIKASHVSESAVRLIRSLHTVIYQLQHSIGSADLWRSGIWMILIILLKLSEEKKKVTDIPRIFQKLNTCRRTDFGRIIN